LISVEIKIIINLMHDRVRLSIASSVLGRIFLC